MKKPAEEALAVLETARLYLRPIEEGDYPLLLRVASDPGTTRYLYFWALNGITPEADARRFMDYALKCRRAQPMRAWEYCLILKESGEKIGGGGVEWVEWMQNAAELSWVLLPEYRGRGYATEMGRELMRAAFEIMGADQVIAHCDARNAPSYHVMERLGMTLSEVEKGARPAKRPGEKNGDECTYVISRAEWEAFRA